MSMNLYFRVKNVSSFVKVDFPWQTPTKISYAVIAAPTLEEKLKILQNSISHWDKDMIKIQMDIVKQLLKLDTLELEVG